jgi:ankyrin repeat protein
MKDWKNSITTICRVTSVLFDVNINANFNQRLFLVSDYDQMSRHFKHLYIEVCQIPFAAGQNDHQETIVKFILDCANDKNPVDTNGTTPLHIAALNGDRLTVLLILQYFKDKNPAGKNGRTPLHWAARYGCLEIVKLLLEHADEKNPEDKYGGTPLHDAANYGRLEIVKLILEHAKYNNPADNNGWTPLHNAAR